MAAKAEAEAEEPVSIAIYILAAITDISVKGEGERRVNGWVGMSPLEALGPRRGRALLFWDVI